MGKEKVGKTWFYPKGFVVSVCTGCGKTLVLARGQRLANGEIAALEKRRGFRVVTVRGEKMVLCRGCRK